MNDLPRFSTLEKPEDVPRRHPSHLHSLGLSGAGGKAVHVNTITLSWKTQAESRCGKQMKVEQQGLQKCWPLTGIWAFLLRERKNGEKCSHVLKQMFTCKGKHKQGGTFGGSLKVYGLNEFFMALPPTGFSFDYNVFLKLNTLKVTNTRGL